MSRNSSQMSDVFQCDSLIVDSVYLFRSAKWMVVSPGHKMLAISQSNAKYVT